MLKGRQLWLILATCLVCYAVLRSQGHFERVTLSNVPQAVRRSSPGHAGRGSAEGALLAPSLLLAQLHDLHVSNLRSLPRNCSLFERKLREYAAWRAETIAQLSADGDQMATAAARGLKFVVVGSVGGGLGDRLPFMLSALTFSMRYKRLFFVDWPPFSKYVYSPFMDWELDRKALPKLAARVHATRVKTIYSCENPGSIHPCLFAEDQPNVTYSEDVLHVAGNRGTWSSGSLRPHMYWYRDEIIDGVAACPYQALFRPKPELLKRAQPMLERFQRIRASKLNASAPDNTKIIGFHYRSGDGVMHGNRNFTVDDMEKGYSAQLQLCATTSNAVVFLLSDSAQLRADAIRRFGADRVITTDLMPRHVGDVEVRNNKVDEEETVASALTEWWLLADTDYIVVGRMASGFAKLAVLASSHARIAYSQVMHGKPLDNCRANAVSAAVTSYPLHA